MTASRGTIRVGWKVSTLFSGMASVRYRALLPILSIQEPWIESRLLYAHDDQFVEELSVLVIVKSFRAEDVALVQRASARGTRVIFDLCDNIFIDSYQSVATQLRPLRILETMVPFLDAMVVTTEPLAEAVRRHFPATPVHVIADGIETPETRRIGQQLIQDAVHAHKAQRLQRWSRLMRSRFMLVRGEGWRVGFWLILKALRRSAFAVLRRVHTGFAHLSSRPKVKNRANPVEFQSLPSPAVAKHRIVWFGNHGAPHARFGMLDLLEIRDALETIAREFSVELVVISNNAEKFAQHIKPLAIPSRYVEWSPSAIEQWVRGACVAVVPNSLDAFSICKSANRAVLAVSLGVPVVATATPALAPLAQHIHLGDPLEGLRWYLKNPASGRSDAEAASRLAREIFGTEALGHHWAQLLQNLVDAPPRQRATDAQCVVVLNLTQDLDLALPVLAAASAEGLTTGAWCSAALVTNSPRVLTQLRLAGVPVRILSDDPQPEASDWPPSLRVLMTIAETNLGPHRFSRRLSELAAQRGVQTVTMQHGFENVGLTYDDHIHRISRINFIATRIYIWGPRSTLHPRVNESVRSRCVPIGCPKAAMVPTAELGNVLKDQQVVGIFENLHWQRYDDTYRASFLEGVDALATAFPEVLFLIKPHHAGLWLTLRHKGERPGAANILVADPKDPLWETHTAPALFGWMSAVITTPSTVALDAARRGMPVAVVAGDIQLDNYAPLPLLRSSQDWVEFVLATQRPQSNDALRRKSTAFVDRVLIPGDAAQRIAADLKSITQT